VNSDEKKLELQNNDGVQYRDDLKNRVRNLEAMLANSSNEKDTLRQQVLDLVAEVNTLRVKVEFLEKENQRLTNK
jgi:predicted nuclease with TOPRIM domain